MSRWTALTRGSISGGALDGAGGAAIGSGPSDDSVSWVSGDDAAAVGVDESLGAAAGAGARAFPGGAPPRRRKGEPCVTGWERRPPLSTDASGALPPAVPTAVAGEGGAAEGGEGCVAGIVAIAGLDSEGLRGPLPIALSCAAGTKGAGCCASRVAPTNAATSARPKPAPISPALPEGDNPMGLGRSEVPRAWATTGGTDN
jgi:hypothetical protein